MRVELAAFSVRMRLKRLKSIICMCQVAWCTNELCNVYQKLNQVYYSKEIRSDFIFGCFLTFISSNESKADHSLRYFLQNQLGMAKSHP